MKNLTIILKNNFNTNYMIKKIITVIIALLVFSAVVKDVYNNPEKILDEKTQEKLIDTADKVDKSIENAMS
jgi:ABC-type uncharacterized transport system permease subunit